MIDLHLHLLPAVDDGPPDLASALALAKALVAAGVARAVVTPHFDSWTAAVLPDRHAVRLRADELQRALGREAIDLHIEAGGECYFSPELRGLVRTGTAPVCGQAPGLLLVELPRSQRLLHLESLLAGLMRCGPRVLLAHAERYAFVQANHGALDQLVEAGLLLQLTASAFRSVPVAATAEALLRRGIVHVVASDVHNAQSVPGMTEGLERLRSLAGDAVVHLLCEENPAALLDGTGAVRPARPTLRAGRRWFPFVQS